MTRGPSRLLASGANQIKKSATPILPPNRNCSPLFNLCLQIKAIDGAHTDAKCLFARPSRNGSQERKTYYYATINIVRRATIEWNSFIVKVHPILLHCCSWLWNKNRFPILECLLLATVNSKFTHWTDCCTVYVGKQSPKDTALCKVRLQFYCSMITPSMSITLELQMQLVMHDQLSAYLLQRQFKFFWNKK